MNPGHFFSGPEVKLICIAWLFFVFDFPVRGQGAPPADEIRIQTAEGKVEISPKGAATWVFTQSNQVVRAGDRLRTGPNSRMSLLLSDQSVAEFGEITELEVLPPHEPQARAGLRLLQGIFSFFHRDKPGRIRVITRGAAAGVDGTEFVMQVEMVDNIERTTLSVIDGIVRFSNEQGGISVTNMQQAVAIPGQIPALTAGFVVNNVLQWAFYYPAVLNLDELPLAPDEEQALAQSIAHYRAGELLAALANYPAGRQLGSAAERVYYAALLLSVGQVAKAETNLVAADVNPRLNRLSTVLRQLIAAVKGDPNPAQVEPELSSEFLAASYYEQSLGRGDESLLKALELARRAVAVAPKFAFGWARVAELEFSFGRSGKALEAVERSLRLAPHNPEALALKGFLLAARNKTREALKYFDQAIAIDPGLGNAWLGRGLTRIRRGDLKGGRADLLVAAAAEPQRSVLRSYLGKAYAESGWDVLVGPRASESRGVRAEPKLALHELELAKRLDPHDPTAWLYSALIKQQQNRINEAVEDLEKSQGLNENRALYRSKLLLDQDRAVRSANLANIYRDAGMQDWSLFEAGRAVSADYANYSAHLFLANSYDELRDPNRINLRYETPAEVEYLVANLLAPVGAGPLSQAISQNEYSRLFERDRLGISSTTEYLSRGAWTERGAQYGTIQNTAYSLEAFYRTDPGQRVNNDFEERDLRLKLKQQITPQDSVYAEAIYYEATGGDRVQYYDPANVNQRVRTRENQDPLLLLGYHHQWQPGVDTLLLAGRLTDRYSVHDPTRDNLLIDRTSEGITFVSPFFVNESYRRVLEIYSAELQQIWQHSDHTLILGGRFQSGDFRFENFQRDPISPYVVYIIPNSQTPVANQDITVDFERAGAYAYYTWQVVQPLALMGGVSYDRITFPEHFASTPVLETEDTVDQLSPKAGVIWTPAPGTTIRGAYTRSLSGATIDQSVQLEPVQVAGFLQSFRSIIPESVAGAIPGAKLETSGVSLEQKFGHGTYMAVGGQILRSDINQALGLYQFLFAGGGYAYTNMGSTHKLRDYKEKSVSVTLHQLIDAHWAVSARYRLAEADMDVRYPEVTTNAFLENFRSSQDLQATLHQLNLNLLFNHDSGFFSRFEATWYFQHSGGYEPDLAKEDFWQFHFFAGYRFPRRKAELQIGILNLTDQDYRLNPLTLYNELPRDRTLMVRWQMNF